MNKFAQLGADIAKLWLKYGNSYFGGIKNTLIGETIFPCADTCDYPNLR